MDSRALFSMVLVDNTAEHTTTAVTLLVIVWTDTSDSNSAVEEVAAATSIQVSLKHDIDRLLHWS